MGKTYHRQSNKFDEEKQSSRSGKHHVHSNNRKSGGMRIINDVYEDDDLFDDNVEISDEVVINKTRDETS